MRRALFPAYSLLAVLACLYMLVVPTAQAQSDSHVLITQNVDESKLVTLYGNTRPEAQEKENDRGRVADDMALDHMLLQLKRSPEQERELEQLIDQLTDKSSPNFHQWLTAKEFGERFGVAQQDRDTITRWLESYGFKVNIDYTSGILLDFSGTARQVREAFRTEIHTLNVNGVKHIANMSDPRIPAALAPAVVGVVSLHDFKPHTNYEPKRTYTFGTCFIGGPCYVVGPGDLATIYNLNPLFSAGISGQGQTIVVVEDTNLYTTADWTKFRSTFGLSSYTGGSLSQVHPAPPSGTNNCTSPGTNGDDGEAILDTEYASAAAPSAAIELISCSDTATTFGGLFAIQNLLNESSTPPAIMSMSYGECEAENGATSNAAFNTAFQQAVTEGVSVFVSSGDDAASGCDRDVTSATHGIGVNGWGSSPYVVSVGGTDFGDTYAGTNSTYWNATNSSTYESAISYINEIPWNDSCASVLFAEFAGYSETYGASGYCNSDNASENGLLDTSGGSGGPSGCATGAPTTAGVVSGTCKGWPKPSYQSLVGNPSDGVRDLPDVSLFAANGIWDHYYTYCWSDTSQGGVACTGAPSGWSGAGGTSFASPIMAAIQSLVNQKAGARQGNPNPTYYSLAATEYGASGDCNSTLGNAVSTSCIFYDVTQGDMDVNCTGTHDCYLDSQSIGVLSTSNTAYDLAYGTQTGWDFATGIGTVNAYNLVNGWPSTSTPNFALSANPPSVTVAEGGSGTSTITVTSSGGFTGSVALTASGLPSGVTAAFSPTSTTTTSTLTLTASATATTGAATITIKGVSGALTNTTTVSLTVTGGPAVTLSPTSLAFGSVVENTTSAAKKVTLTNSGSGALTITSIVPSAGFAISTKTCGTSLAAAAKCTVSVTFGPTALGAVTGTLTFTDNASNSPQTVALTGTGVVSAALTSATATYVAQAVGTTSTAKTFTLTNYQTVALTGIAISTTGDFAVSATTCTTSLAAKGKCTISVTFTPTTTGTLTGTLKITDSANTSPQTSTLKGTGEVAAALTPATETYAAQTVNTTSAAKTLTLTNNQTVALTSIAISTTGDFAVSATTCTTSLAAKGKCTISVTFTPTTTGTLTGTLKVTDSAGNSPQSSSLTGTGKAAAAVK